MFKNPTWLVVLWFLLSSVADVFSLNTWPSTTWNNAVNISSVLPTSAKELSGLYWNNELACLYAVGDEGSVYLLELNKQTNIFKLIGSATGIGGPEGITQVGNNKNEFYIIDENNYEIRKYNFKTNFNAVTLQKSWNLLQSPSVMTNTGNTGPEGIAFIPDSYLQQIGFVSSSTGKTYISTKGMGGLMFIAHQDGGYIWVFDVNPNVNNDFAYVGRYKTNRTESCDLSFDYSTGMLYILHNLDDNYLEVSNLATTKVSTEYQLNTVAEYPIPNPSGSINIEGIAVSPKYPQNSSLGLWLCRDVTKSTEVADAIRWFNTFIGEGSEIETGLDLSIYEQKNFTVFYSAKGDNIHINNNLPIDYNCSLYDSLGRLKFSNTNLSTSQIISCRNLNNGIYFVITLSENHLDIFKIIIYR